MSSERLEIIARALLKIVESQDDGNVFVGDAENLKSVLVDGYVDFLELAAIAVDAAPAETELAETAAMLAEVEATREAVKNADFSGFQDFSSRPRTP